MLFGAPIPSDFDILSAKALLEIRSIIVKHPKRRTSLLPYAWSRRYGFALGSYEAFVKSHIPDIFKVHVSEFTGLLTVELVDEFANRGYMVYQQIISKSKSPTESSTHVSEDHQYLSLCNIRDSDKQASICGGKEFIEKAMARILQIIKLHPVGCSIEKARQYLTQEGILPIPLEWFDSIVVVTRHDNVYLRKRAVMARSDTNPELVSKIESFLLNCPNKSMTIEELNMLCLLPPTEVLHVLRSCPRVFFEPDMMYPCGYFQEVVEGYCSPEQMRVQCLSNELSTMSPMRHLLRSIGEIIQKMPDKRIPTEYIMAWCAALDVKPRLVWQCMQDKVFWSGPLSNHQIVLRSSGGRSRHPHPDQDAVLPRDLVAEIVCEIKRLGSKCTLEKLIANLQWGKGTLYRKLYGPLAVLLPGISEIFYDPAYMYDKVTLDQDVIWPDAELADVETLALRCESDWQNLANFSASMVYYLSHSGLQTYPLQDCLNSIAQYGFLLNDVIRMSHLFVPGDVVYLRKALSAAEIDFPETSIEFAVLYALRTSSLKALDIERLFTELIASKRFSMDGIDMLRSTLGSSCGDFEVINSDLSYFCYYNPSIVTLRSYASHYMFIDVLSTIAAPVGAFVPQAKQPNELNLPEEIVDEEQARVETVIPKWCMQDVLVNIGDNENIWVIKCVGGDGTVTLVDLLDDTNTRQESYKSIRPKPSKAGDKVWIMEGPWTGRSGQLVGLSKLEGSIQMSKFEFKSIVLSSIVPIK